MTQAETVRLECLRLALGFGMTAKNAVGFAEELLAFLRADTRPTIREPSEPLVRRYEEVP